MIKTLVETINETKETISELKEMKKKLTKEIEDKKLELEGVSNNIEMWKKILDNMEATRNEEINKVMAGKNSEKEEPVVEEGINWIMVDEDHKTVKTFKSQADISRDLGINDATLSYRLKKWNFDKQIHEMGCAIIPA